MANVAAVASTRPTMPDGDITAWIVTWNEIFSNVSQLRDQISHAVLEDMDLRTVLESLETTRNTVVDNVNVSIREGLCMEINTALGAECFTADTSLPDHFKHTPGVRHAFLSCSELGLDLTVSEPILLQVCTPDVKADIAKAKASKLDAFAQQTSVFKAVVDELAALLPLNNRPVAELQTIRNSMAAFIQGVLLPAPPTPILALADNLNVGGDDQIVLRDDSTLLFPHTTATITKLNDICGFIRTKAETDLLLIVGPSSFLGPVCELLVKADVIGAKDDVIDWTDVDFTLLFGDGNDAKDAVAKMKRAVVQSAEYHDLLVSDDDSNCVMLPCSPKPVRLTLILSCAKIGLMGLYLQWLLNLVIDDASLATVRKMVHYRTIIRNVSADCYPKPDQLPSASRAVSFMNAIVADVRNNESATAAEFAGQISDCVTVCHTTLLSMKLTNKVS